MYYPLLLCIKLFTLPLRCNNTKYYNLLQCIYFTIPVNYFLLIYIHNTLYIIFHIIIKKNKKVRNSMYHNHWYPESYNYNNPMYHTDYRRQNKFHSKDYGPAPFVVNIEEATKQNSMYRSALWTGKHLQVTLMCIRVGGDIGLEIHPDLDQFIRIEEGEGIAMMGDKKDCLDFKAKVCDNFAIIVPAGKWHNLVNTGRTPLKLYSIYAPPEHPHGTVHPTKEIAMEEEHHHH